MELASLHLLTLCESFLLRSEIFDLTLFLGKLRLELLDLLFEELCLSRRCTLEAISISDNLPRRSFLKRTSHCCVDQFSHSLRLLSHNGLPLCLHLVKHLGWSVHAFYELPLLLGIFRLHSAQHRLLALDLVDLSIDFLQVI